MKYIKKPIPIEIEIFDPEKGMEGVKLLTPISQEIDVVCAYGVETLEGTMFVNPGDPIATGIYGEKYPIKPDIFVATYVSADDYRPYCMDCKSEMVKATIQNEEGDWSVMWLCECEPDMDTVNEVIKGDRNDRRNKD